MAAPDTAVAERGRGGLARWANAPRTYKAVVVLVAYLALYLLLSNVVALVAGDTIDRDDSVSSASSIFVGLALPTLLGAAMLIAFVTYVGWRSAIFGRQPMRGSWWMWIGPLLVLVAVVAHCAQVRGGRWSGADFAALAALGVGVGLAEEIATRGIAVKMLRDAGHGERFVAIGSSLLFSLMHLANLFAGMSLKVVASTVVYTFGFGVCMYLAMRVTGTIWAAIVLHGLTDPTTILASGGVDKAVQTSGSGSAAQLVAVAATFLMIGFALVAVLLIRRPASR